MTDVVLIQNSVAHEIFRNTTLEEVGTRFHADLVAQMVEVASNSVNDQDVWDGHTFSAPPPLPSPTIIPYAKFRAQWSDAEKTALHAAMISSWQIDDFVGLARAQNSVNLSGETAPLAKAALVSASVLTQQRADILFNPDTYA